VPIYEFDCTSCGARFEVLTSSHAVAPKCPECGAAATERRLSQVAPISTVGLKGYAAKKSNETRRAREERRQEGFAKQREERKQQGK